MLVDFKPRLYQETIFSSSANKNTLVVLPTGLGKTAISIMLAAHRLKLYPQSKIVILAPTKPLVEQHMRSFMDKLRNYDDDFVLFTGMVAPNKRAELWNKSKFIFSTPQGLENDIISKRINMSEVSLIVFDEAHRATGDYSYVFISSQYQKLAKNELILALTASPGSEKEKVDEICKNLFIENIEVRSRDDADVKPYIKETTVEWKEVNLPMPFLQVKEFLDKMYKEKMLIAKNYGYIKTSMDLSRKQLISIMGSLQKEMLQGEKTPELLKTISLISEVLKISHAQELLESQGIHPLFSYLKNIESQAATSKTKAVKNLVADPSFKSVLNLIKNMRQANLEHPKMVVLKDIVNKNIGKRIIIFSQFRETGKRISEELNMIEGVYAKSFVGQAKKSGTGLSQKEQLRTIQDFKESKFNILVMTSVGEEGLDIPQVDMVLFYEPVPSAIRSIQRRGRTGRLQDGSVIVLVAKATRDEIYRWSSFHKERRMLKIMKEIKDKKNLELHKKQQSSLYEFENNPTKHKVCIDYREKNSLIAKALIDYDFDIELRKLEVGDYLLSDRVVVEYKKVLDFVDSIIDGRLLLQARSLREYYMRPLVIVEGTEDMYSLRKIDPKAIQGMITTITVSYGIPIIFTKNAKETSSLFSVIIKREQSDQKKEFSFHSAKPLSLKQQQEYVVSSLPGIGPTLAKPLLEKFGSVSKVLNSNIKELKTIDLIGDKKAKEIRRVLDEVYKK